MKKNILMLLLFPFMMVSCNNTQTSDNQTMTINKKQKLEHLDWTKHSNIYEVNIRQYTVEGTFNAFDKHLDRLAKMGVDILWLMPISPIGEKNRKGSLGSYYSIKDYRGINPEFGTMEDFKNLVNHAHKLGMHLIIDWVANHTAWDHPWVKDHPEWYRHDSEGNIESPFDWTDVVALNYENHELWKAMANEMKFWLTNADIDGFRCDVAMLVKTEFWDSARVELDKVKPVFMLAEAELPEHHFHAFDMSYAWEMHHVFADVASGKKPATVLNDRIIQDRQLFNTDDYRMQFTTNHDENTWNGTEYEKMGDGAKIMAVLTFVIPGMPLIYSGQEAANKKRLRFFDKDTLNWDSIPLADFYKNLIDLKNENSALWNGDFGGSYLELPTNCPEHVFAFVREKDNNRVVFVGNMSDISQNIKISFGDFAGQYQDWFTKDNVEFIDTNDFVLEPWQYNIFVK